jgi:hypothetical protein
MGKRRGKEPEVSGALEAARATSEGGAEGGGAEGGGAEGGGCATGGLGGAQRQYLYFCTSKACKLSTCGLGGWGSWGSGLVFVLLYQ